MAASVTDDQLADAYAPPGAPKRLPFLLWLLRQLPRRCPDCLEPYVGDHDCART